MLLQLLLLLLCMVGGGWCGCDVNYGPAGTTECAAFSLYYYQYQWATCLTNAYIKQKSNHKHQCRNRFAKYCYYQCMLEVNGKESGGVSKDCSCTPSSSRTTPFPWLKPTTLPSECQSPSGESCQWYRNCLEKKYPCEDTTNAYAIKYAENFCNLYEQNRLWFSSKGQQWIDAVRKCLQVALVPLLRPWRSPSCSEIRRAAFDSHTPCYLKPDQGAPSVCDLECFEFYKIFWTIKGSFGKLDTAGESLKGMWNIMNRCGLKCTQTWFRKNKLNKVIKMGIQNLKQRVRSRRSSGDLLPEDKRNRFAEKVVSAIANVLKWNSEVMDWFSYSDNSSTILYVVLADKKALGIVTTSAAPVRLNETIEGLAMAIQNSTLPVQIDGSNIWLKSLEYCSEKSCSQPKSLAISEKPPVFPSGGQTMVENGLLVGISFLVQSLILLWSNKP